MKLLTYKNQMNRNYELGVKTKSGILDVKKAWEKSNSLTTIPLTINEWFNADELSKKIFEDLVNSIRNSDTDYSDCYLQEESLQFGPCVPNSGKIICVGLNYKKHAVESKMELPASPVLFSKYSNALAGHNTTIELPADSSQVDFEAELGIIIGTSAKNVSKDTALSYVAGYCNVNDLSARDLQFRTNQWLLGKSCDGFCPVGPYLVTADEVDNPNQLMIETIVNGSVRQYSNTSDMIFYCDEIVSYISNYITLEPGDIILTGTPEGVIFGLPISQQDWLKEGDKVTIKFEKLGELTNEFKAPLFK